MGHVGAEVDDDLWRNTCRVSIESETCRFQVEQQKEACPDEREETTDRSVTVAEGGTTDSAS